MTLEHQKRVLNEYAYEFSSLSIHLHAYIAHPYLRSDSCTTELRYSKTVIMIISYLSDHNSRLGYTERAGINQTRKLQTDSRQV